MAQERRDPLPPGRYWITAMGDDAMAELDSWLVAHADKIHLEHSEYDPGEAGAFTNPMPHEFAVWTVVTPVPWASSGFKALGFPNTADADVQTEADTVQRPEPEHIPTLTETIENVVDEAKFGALVVLAILWLWSSNK